MARSESFILDRETGEPKHKPFTYEKYQAWKLIVKDSETGKRKVKLHWSYSVARQEAETLTEKYGNRIEAHVVSRQIGYGPPYSKITDLQLLRLNEVGKFWCPYCRKMRLFLWSAWREERCCEFCRTRLSEFHVQRNNPLLWDPVRIKRLKEQL